MSASPSPAVVTAGAPAAAAVAAVNGQMAAKLEGIGLTQAQIEAVLALSKDIVERVVWEVVPVLAETLIKRKPRAPDEVTKERSPSASGSACGNLPSLPISRASRRFSRWCATGSPGRHLRLNRVDAWF